ncbi:MAG: helix-turn-helix domain-containing protein [Aquihabitans sp.]
MANNTSPSADLQQKVNHALQLITRAKGKRQVDIAKLLGTSEGTVSRRLKGQGNWKVDELAVICGAADAPITALFDTEALTTYLASTLHDTPADMDISPTKWLTELPAAA